MNCAWREVERDGSYSCRVASSLARIADDEKRAAVTNEACVFCHAQAEAMAPNHVTYSIAIYHLKNEGKLDINGQHAYLRDGAKGQVPKSGPGTSLSKFFSWLDTEGCDCKAHQQMMDLWGPALCRERIDEILSWLRTEAARKGIPFIEAAARGLVMTAIMLHERRGSETV
jgi:hypothetical protein